jgi:hypothetical protein
MKRIILSLTIMALFSSCLPEQQVASSSSSSGDSSSGTTTTTVDNGNGTTTSGGTDTGTGNTGGSGFPVHNFNILLAGYQNWYPRSNTEPLANTFITPQEAAIAFQTDGLLRIRLRANPQPRPPTNEQYCYGRNTGIRVPNYGDLTVDLHLVDIKCPSGGISCDPSQYILGQAYRPKNIGPVTVSSNSEIIDIGQYANQGVVATAIKISNARKDQGNETVRSMDCWSMDVEVQTSYTQSF